MVDVADAWQHERLAKQRLMEDWYSTYQRPYHQYWIRPHASSHRIVHTAYTHDHSSHLEHLRSLKRRRPASSDYRAPVVAMKSARKLPSVHTILAPHTRTEGFDAHFPSSSARVSGTACEYEQEHARRHPTDTESLSSCGRRPTLSPTATSLALEESHQHPLSHLPPLAQSIDHTKTPSVSADASCAPCVSPREPSSVPPPSARSHLDDPKISPTGSQKRLSAATDVPSRCGGGEGPTKRRPVKTSRYLREMDRREILARIDQGEKQSALAKEFHVSRAAICNLVKHRDEVLARIHENPYAKHPKKPRKSFLSASSSSSSLSSGCARSSRVVPIRPYPSTSASQMAPQAPNRYEHPYPLRSLMMPRHEIARVREIRNRGSVNRLLTRLQDTTLSDDLFGHGLDHLAHLLLQEAIACGRMHVHPDEGSGAYAPLHTCAISLEPSEGAFMLRVFQSMEPLQPIGFVQVNAAANRDNNYGRQIFADEQVSHTSIPAEASQDCHVCLLALTTNMVSGLGMGMGMRSSSSFSGYSVCCAIQKLLDRGVPERMLSVVSMFVSIDALNLIHRKFPLVRVITAQVLPRSVGATEHSVFSRVSSFSGRPHLYSMV